MKNNNLHDPQTTVAHDLPPGRPEKMDEVLHDAESLTSPRDAGTASSQKFVIVKERSQASKLGCCAATYVPYQTCPGSGPNACPLKPKIRPDGSFEQDWCYASCGTVGINHMGHITKAAVGVPLNTIAKEESDGVARLRGDKPCRLHVGGETADSPHAMLLAAAAEVYTAKHGKPVWSYTHNWRVIPRTAFGNISILASCELPEQVLQANALGYAAALLIPDFPESGNTFSYGGVKVLPCPAAIDDTTHCDTCGGGRGWCMRDGWLKQHGLTIGLKIHSGNKAKARELAEVLR